jgi:hypothetical protein
MTSVILGLGIAETVYLSKGQALTSDTLVWVAAGIICVLM